MSRKKKILMQRTDRCACCGGPFPKQRMTESDSTYKLRKNCGTKCQRESARLGMSNACGLRGQKKLQRAKR